MNGEAIRIVYRVQQVITSGRTGQYARGAMVSLANGFDGSWSKVDVITMKMKECEGCQSACCA